MNTESCMIIKHHPQTNFRLLICRKNRKQGLLKTHYSNRYQLWNLIQAPKISHLKLPHQHQLNPNNKLFHSNINQLHSPVQTHIQWHQFEIHKCMILFNSFSNWKNRKKRTLKNISNVYKNCKIWRNILRIITNVHQNQIDIMINRYRNRSSCISKLNRKWKRLIISHLFKGKIIFSNLLVW